MAKEIDNMASLGMALPLQPGKTEAWKKWVQEMGGIRLSEYQASRRKLGITREASFLQQTPQGYLGVLYIEADDIAVALQGLAMSQSPFDVLFRERTLDLFGFDLTQPLPGPPPETVFD